MTPYERGFLDCRERAASLCQLAAEQLSPGPFTGFGAEVLQAAAEKIFALTPEGADQRGAAATRQEMPAISYATEHESGGPVAQSAPHHDLHPDTKAQPVAWRYRYKDGGDWRHVAHLVDANPMPGYEVEPLYAHPASQPEGVVVPRTLVALQACKASIDRILEQYGQVTCGIDFGALSKTVNAALAATRKEP